MSYKPRQPKRESHQEPSHVPLLFRGTTNYCRRNEHDVLWSIFRRTTECVVRRAVKSCQFNKEARNSKHKSAPSRNSRTTRRWMNSRELFKSTWLQRGEQFIFAFAFQRWLFNDFILPSVCNSLRVEHIKVGPCEWFSQSRINLNEATTMIQSLISQSNDLHMFRFSSSGRTFRPHDYVVRQMRQCQNILACSLMQIIRLI